MAYRNWTYIAFHANWTNIPIHSDIKYYNLIKAWTEKTDDDFSIINSHEKTSAVRDTSSKETLARRLRERLNNSKNMVLIIGETTKYDTDWVPFEIEYAAKTCRIPIIVSYVWVEYILDPKLYLDRLPNILKTLIRNNEVSCIHIPFKKEPLKDAISQFNHSTKSRLDGLGYYSRNAYVQFWIL